MRLEVELRICPAAPWGHGVSSAMSQCASYPITGFALAVLPFLWPARMTDRLRSPPLDVTLRSAIRDYV